MSSKKDKASQGSSAKQKQTNKGEGKQKKQVKGGNQRKGSTSQGNEEDVKREQKLQAVLLADSFAQTFRPITLETPNVLLPIVNIPMIDYTIEFLAQNGVEEVIVYCVWFASTIESYLLNSKWPSLLSIRCVSSVTSTSAGDALRDLDSQNIVRSDPFILISGDIISNLNLKKAIEFHKMKRKQDPNNIMTCIFKKVQRLTPSKPLLDDLIVGLNQNTSQLLLFEDMLQEKELNFSLDLLSSNNTSEVTFFTDLLDCNIDICSQEMLLQFSDNFDYQDVRQDFIRNEVTNFALGKHIYAYILQNEYAARVKDPHTYHAISRDIVTRWVYPFVPDIPLLGEDNYLQSKRYVYKSQGIKISRTAAVEEEVVIGRGTAIGSRSSVTKTIIGRDNLIGNDVSIANSHIWNKVLIEDDVQISGAIICDNAIIRKGAVIPRGCIVSFGVEVGPAVRLPEFTRLMKKQGAETRGRGGGEEAATLEKVEGRVWRPDENCRFYYPKRKDSLSEEEVSLDREVRLSSIGCVEEELWRRQLWSSELPKPSEEEDEDYDEDSYEDLRLNSDELDLPEELEEKKRPQDEENLPRDEVFCRNIVELVITAAKEGHPADSTHLEIMGLKFAQNKSFGDCLQGVVQALFVLILEKSAMSQTILQLLKQHTKSGALIYFLLKKLTQDERNEIEIISFVEDFAMDSIYIQPLFRFILQILHDAGIDTAADVEDEDEALRVLSTRAILTWAQRRKALSASNPRSRFVRDEKVSEFLEWLQDEDEDGEEDSQASSSLEEEED